MACERETKTRDWMLYYVSHRGCPTFWHIWKSRKLLRRPQMAISQNESWQHSSRKSAKHAYPFLNKKAGVQVLQKGLLKVLLFFLKKFWGTGHWWVSVGAVVPSLETTVWNKWPGGILDDNKIFNQPHSVGRFWSLFVAGLLQQDSVCRSLLLKVLTSSLFLQLPICLPLPLGPSPHHLPGGEGKGCRACSSSSCCSLPFLEKRSEQAAWGMRCMSSDREF